MIRLPNRAWAHERNKFHLKLFLKRATRPRRLASSSYFTLTEPEWSMRCFCHRFLNARIERLAFALGRHLFFFVRQRKQLLHLCHCWLVAYDRIGCGPNKAKHAKDWMCCRENGRLHFIVDQINLWLLWNGEWATYFIILFICLLQQDRDRAFFVQKYTAESVI